MEFLPTELPEILVLTPRRFADARGVFCETYNRRGLKEAGIDVEFVQDNQSLSVPAGVLRGMHFQVPPMAQAKLVRVIRGSVVDVAVDVRPKSATFGRHVMVKLSAENGKQVFIPPGFAHGFLTLEPNTEVVYKVSSYYSPEHERGLKWNDPKVGINWPKFEGELTMTERDRGYPGVEELGEIGW